MKSFAVIATVTLIGFSLCGYASDTSLKDVKFGRTVQGPELTPDEMKGQVVLVTHWGAHCGTCVALLSEWESLYKKYNEQGLHVVGLEMDKITDGEVNNVCKAKKVDFQVNVDGNLMINGHANWPRTFLFDASGKLIADSVYGKELENKIKGALAEANGFDPGYGPYNKLSALAAQVKAGQQLGQALKTLVSKKESKDGAEAAEAKMMFEALNGRGQELLTKALAAKEAKPLAAITKLDKLAQQFEGCDLGKTAKEEASKLKSDPAIKKEIESADMYTQLQKLCDGLRPVQGNSDPKSESYRRANAQTIQSLIAGCQTIVQRYPGTKAAAQAEALMGEYR